MLGWVKTWFWKCIYTLCIYIHIYTYALLQTLLCKATSYKWVTGVISRKKHGHVAKLLRLKFFPFQINHRSFIVIISPSKFNCLCMKSSANKIPMFPESKLNVFCQKSKSSSGWHTCKKATFPSPKKQGSPKMLATILGDQTWWCCKQ